MFPISVQMVEEQFPVSYNKSFYAAFLKSASLIYP
uniref:Uncharacterized protein n=1 Tax=Glossina morsitans morsitans TaxID=37546 RepID=A0A1B0G4Y9_GLOMM